jgi:hypothetical protein
MTGSWGIKKNGVIIPQSEEISPGTDPIYKDGWPSQDHFEGLEVPQKVWDLMMNCEIGDKIEVTCELPE